MPSAIVHLEPGTRWSGPSRRASGMTLMEVTVAVGMLAVLLAGSAPVFRMLSAQQRAAEHRAVALQAAQNLLEQLTNTPWDELTPESAENLTLPAKVAAHLPGAEVDVTLAEEHDAVEAKRVSIVLTWNSFTGGRAGPVRLTTWIYPGEPASQ